MKMIRNNVSLISNGIPRKIMTQQIIKKFVYKNLLLRGNDIFQSDYRAPIRILARYRWLNTSTFSNIIKIKNCGKYSNLRLVKSYKMMKLIVCFTITSISYCQICQSNQVQYGGACWQSCPENTALTFKNGAYTCEQCDLTRFLVFDPNTASCKCALQTYINPINNQCSPCHYTCLTCKGPNPNDCIICENIQASTSREFSGGQCLCKKGFFDDNSVSSIKCFPCHRDCQLCNGLSDVSCLTCSNGKTKNQFGLCVCSNGFIENDQGQCICPPPLTVFSDGFCKNTSTSCGFNEEPSKISTIAKAAQNQKKCVCLSGLVRIKGKCDVCQGNEVYDSKKGRCQCPSNGFKFKQKCIICPAGQNFNKKSGACVCKKNESITENGSCVKCPLKSVYQQGACVCIFNYYMDNKGKCKKCNKKSENLACSDIQGQDRPRKLHLNQI